MALILCLETSSVNCSVALFSDGLLLNQIESSDGYAHAEKLHPFIAQVLAKSGKKMDEIQAVMIGSGPGSFTGLRIGSAAAKGICFALSIPLLSQSSLFNMTLNCHEKFKPVNSTEKLLYCPLIDARRMEVYSCVYDRDLNIVGEVSAVIADENTYKELAKTNNLVFFGDGMNKIRDLYAGENKVQFIENILPSAQYMGKTAEEKFKRGEFEDVAYFEPYYLKGFHFTTPKDKF